MRHISLFILSLILLTPVGSGCVEKSGEKPDDGKLKIVATTGMIEDAARQIAGDKAEVHALMGPGVDPHLYKASQGDLSLLTGSDVIFYNGLHLEGKMVEVLENLGRSKKTIAVAESLDKSKLRKPAEFEGNYDPHIWFDVKLWEGAVRSIAAGLKEIDPENAAFYDSNTVAYIARLDSLDNWVRAQIATIPKESRVLITAHDAFGYFGTAYDIEVRGLQGISTVSEFGLADKISLVDFIVSRKVKAVFVESSVPRRSIDALVEGVKSKGHAIVIGGELFSDAMGGAGTPEGSYVGMVSANVNRIVGALR